MKQYCVQRASDGQYLQWMNLSNFFDKPATGWGTLPNFAWKGTEREAKAVTALLPDPDLQVKEML